MSGEERNPCTGERAVGVGSAAAAQSNCDNLSTLPNEVDLVEPTGQVMLGGDVSGADQLPTCDANSIPILVLRRDPCIVEQAAEVNSAVAAQAKCDHMSPYLKMDLVEQFGLIPGGDTSGTDQLPTLAY